MHHCQNDGTAFLAILIIGRHIRRQDYCTPLCHAVALEQAPSGETCWHGAGPKSALPECPLASLLRKFIATGGDELASVTHRSRVMRVVCVQGEPSAHKETFHIVTVEVVEVGYCISSR